LQHPHHDQQDRRHDSHLSVGGQQADDKGRCAHDQQGQDQHPLAAYPVTEVAEDHRPERSGQVADGEGAERDQRARRRREVREEQLVEDQRGRSAVDEEVVPLDDGAEG
jgi:hypothetical protein